MKGTDTNCDVVVVPAEVNRREEEEGLGFFLPPFHHTFKSAISRIATSIVSRSSQNRRKNSSLSLFRLISFSLSLSLSFNFLLSLPLIFFILFPPSFPSFERQFPSLTVPFPNSTQLSDFSFSFGNRFLPQGKRTKEEKKEN